MATVLALAISSEEEDGRIYGEFADGLRESYPASAQMFEEMRAEEANHRDRLIAMYRERFGDHIPPIRRENVKGFLRRNPTWLVRPFGVNKVRRQAEIMEMEAGRFYAKAIRRITDAPTRELLNKLADEERKHHGDNERHRGEVGRLRDDLRVLVPEAHDRNERQADDKGARRDALHSGTCGGLCLLNFVFSI